MSVMHPLATAVWRRIGGRWQWRLLRWREATFLVGLTGVVIDDDGRVLVQVHRYWMGNPCGLPSGWAGIGETWEQGLTREVREETGLTVTDVRVVRVAPVPTARSGPRIEVLLAARVPAPAVPRPDGTEVLAAEFVDLAEARRRLRPEHLGLIDLAVTS
ncbi:MAG: NUDIX hydrolase [Humibacillus sp.]|nr:NUDIX hydrolase [Humibacillus sp.]MDN5779637.1 NUDIX hydrolase [Humibacillus sp.]